MFQQARFREYQIKAAVHACNELLTKRMKCGQSDMIYLDFA
jgi:hypothetical protein